MAVNIARTATIKEHLCEVFARLNARSCPTEFNFHMHTVYSDGRLQPSVLMEQAIAIGLKGLAITDHHTVGGYEVAHQWLDDWKWNHPGENAPYLWTGIEINANLLDVEVHILGYGFNINAASLKPYTQRRIVSGNNYKAKNVIAAIHQAGGIAVLAHPARYRKPCKDLIPAAAALGIDGAEAFYAYNNPNPWQPSIKETEQVQKLALEYGLYTTCGTDTHGNNLLQRI